MTRAAREVLTVISNGEHRPGIVIYGIRSPRKDVPPGATELWPDAERCSTFLLHGDGWEVPMWEIALRRWPAPGDFDAALSGTFTALFSEGCVLAWVGAELFADPPDLFLPEFMSGGVLVAATPDQSFGRLDLDSAVEPIGDDQLLQLRELSHGLAAAGG